MSKLRLAIGIRYTENKIINWLKQFFKGDLFDIEFRKRIIDVFINSIFLYDDKLVIYYNMKGSKQVSYIEMLDSTREPGGDDYNEEYYNADLTGVSGVRILNDALRKKKAPHD